MSTMVTVAENNNINCSTYASVFVFATSALQASDLRPMQTSEIHVCKLCFVLSAMTSFAHVTVASCIREIRQLYGVHQMLALYTNLMANICLLAVLFMPRDTQTMLRITFNALTHYNFLCSAFLTTIGAHLVLRALRTAGHPAPIIQIQSFGKFVRRFVVASVTPLLLIIPPLLLDLSDSVHGSKLRNALLPLDACYAHLSCCVTDRPAYLVLLAVPVLLLHFITGCLLFAANCLRHGATEERQQIAKSNANRLRFSSSLKITISGSITWMFGAIATGLGPVYPNDASIFWNIFSICYTLQAIFITITSVFSRPVFEVMQKRMANKELKLDTGLRMLAKAMTTRSNNNIGARTNLTRLRVPL